MISIIGIGTGASKIASNFTSVSNYEVYQLNDKVEKNTETEFRIDSYSTPEEYENNIPDLSSFFADIRTRVQVFVVGSTMSSNYVLGILEQIRDKEIDLFYIQPDVELLSDVPRILEGLTFGVLQEYARSGAFRTMTLLSNLNLEKVLGDLPIKTYYEELNKSVFSTIHHMNYFEFSDPEIGQVSKPSEINRIRTIALLNMKDLEEKWLFDLDPAREMCYYMCINSEKLATEGGLHKRLVDILKKKPKNAFRKISYAIYETEHADFGFTLAHTNVVQEKKVLDNE
jgi:hypothetical protein|tara:strand:- start:27 stop:881 length:855 start_codon:yes stop_codon:yes gene_type:complete